MSVMIVGAGTSVRSEMELFVIIISGSKSITGLLSGLFCQRETVARTQSLIEFKNHQTFVNTTVRLSSC